MIDSDFLIQLVLDGEIKIVNMENFLSIHKNYTTNSKLKNFNHLFLYKPHWNGKNKLPYYEVALERGDKIEISIEEYEKIYEYAEEQDSDIVIKKIKENNSNMIEYFRKKISSYDGGANNKL